MMNEKKLPIFFEEEADEGSWAISYADMITILLAFFTIFFSFESTNSGAEALEQSLLTSLAGPDHLVQLNSNKVDVTNNDWSFVSLEGHDVIIEKIDPFKYAIVFKNLSFFDTSSVVLKRQVYPDLKELVDKLIPFMGQFKIKLHSFTDPRPVLNLKGRKFEDNLELSTLRSLAVYKTLKNFGIPEGRLEIVGGGVLSASFYNKHLSLDESGELDYSKMRTTVIILDREGFL